MKGERCLDECGEHREETCSRSQGVTQLEVSSEERGELGRWEQVGN